MASVEQPLYGRHPEKGKTWPIQVCYADRLAIPVADLTIPGKLSYTVYTIIAVRRRRRAAAADRMSASRRRRFRDVFTSCCTPAICC